MEVNLKNHHFSWRKCVCFWVNLFECLTVVLFSTGCCVELNMSTRAGGGGGNNSSLPGTPGGDTGSANRVLSWAVSFEKLLEDPCGVYHFTVSSIFQQFLVFMSWGVCVCVCIHTVSFSVGLLEIWGERGEHFILAGLWEVQEDPCCLCGWGEMAHLHRSLCMMQELLNSSTSLNVVIKEMGLIIQIWTQSSSKCRQSCDRTFMSDNK